MHTIGKTFTFTPTAKKRISKNMISEPRNFEHLIHTETEAEAEKIFRDWNPSAGKLPGERARAFREITCRGTAGVAWEIGEMPIVLT